MKWKKQDGCQKQDGGTSCAHHVAMWPWDHVLNKQDLNILYIHY